LVLEKKRRFSCRKLSKTIENCDHNIDPWRVWKKLPKMLPQTFFSQKLSLENRSPKILGLLR
jgi:hypothetical protein